MRFVEVREASGEKINNPRDIYKLMEEESKIDRECIWVLHLNTNNEIIEKELVSMGTLDHSILIPREAYKKAILNSDASIIVVHNHPSGNLEASDNDIPVAKRMKESGSIIGIKLRDFLIISKKGYTSFKKEGYI